MNTKNILGLIILVIAGLFLYSFVLPFKTLAVDNVSEELNNLRAADERANEQLTLKKLRLKKEQLGEKEQDLLQNFIPISLHSGSFVYNLSQIANQNKLSVKNLQYNTVEDKDAGEKKLLVEFSLDGRFEDFKTWVSVLENSNVLIDIESIRASKNSNKSDIISFNVRLYTYGISID